MFFLNCLVSRDFCVMLYITSVKDADLTFLCRVDVVCSHRLSLSFVYRREVLGCLKLAMEYQINLAEVSSEQHTSQLQRHQVYVNDVMVLFYLRFHLQFLKGFVKLNRFCCRFVVAAKSSDVEGTQTM